MNWWLQRIEGEVFAYDKQTNLVALKQPGSEPERHTLQFIKTASIKVMPNAPHMQ